MKQQEKQQIQITSHNICNTLRQWSSKTKKQKKYPRWNSFYKLMIKLLLPDIQFEQILFQNQQEQFQQLKFLISSSFVFSQENLSSVYQVKGTQIILILNNGLQLLTYDKSEIKSIIKLPKLSIANQFFSSDVLSQKYFIRTTQQCQTFSIFKGDKKLLQKCKNDLLKQDRICKEKFISQHFFGGHRPNYSLKNLKVIKVRQKQVIEDKLNQIYLIFSGIVRMKIHIIQKQNNFIDLNKGSFLENNKFFQLIKNFMLTNDYSKKLSFQAVTNCTLILMDLTQLQKIFNHQNKIRSFFLRQYSNIWNFRVNLSNNIHFGLQKIEFQKTKNQSKNIFSLSSTSRQNKKSFRIKRNLSDFECQNLITIGIYDQIIKNKEQVAARQKQYQQKSLNSSRQTKSLRNSRIYEDKKKTQQKIKNLKIQNYKIQKIALKLQIDNIQNLRKNMVFIKGIFQDPIPKRQNLLKKQNLLIKDKRIQKRQGTRTKSLFPQSIIIKNEDSRKSLIDLKENQIVKFQNNFILNDCGIQNLQIDKTPFKSIINTHGVKCMKKRKNYQRKAAKHHIKQKDIDVIELL